MQISAGSKSAVDFKPTTEESFFTPPLPLPPLYLNFEEDIPIETGRYHQS